MRLFEDFKIKFEKPDWSRDTELGLIDIILKIRFKKIIYIFGSNNDIEESSFRDVPKKNEDEVYCF